MLLFLGLLYPPEDEKRIHAAAGGSFQAAANTFQWALLRGMGQASGERITVLNSVPMGSFPRHSTILWERDSCKEVEGISVNSQGYCNLPVWKQLQRQYRTYRTLKRSCKTASEPVTVVTYSLYRPYLKAVKRLKKQGLPFRHILIVPDLPGVYGLASGGVVRTGIGRLTQKAVLRLAQYADGYVLLTRQMQEILPVGNKPCTVVEGIYTQEPPEAIPADGKTILYTGTLDGALGIGTLLDAFEKLPKGLARLQIAGSGNYEPQVRRRCQENEAIDYLGFLPREEVRRLQSQAAVLVNPRPASEEYTKYSFPSKTMEYLASGKPVVMYPLPGIPAEYHKHLYFAETQDADGLAAKLLEVLQTEPEVLEERGKMARRFILEEKNGAAQAKKLLNLLKDP